MPGVELHLLALRNSIHDLAANDPIWKKSIAWILQKFGAPKREFLS